LGQKSQWCQQAGHQGRLKEGCFDILSINAHNHEECS